MALLSLSPADSHAQGGVVVNMDAGRGVNPFFATENGNASNNIFLRFGTFNSVSDADVRALGYNLLWVGNQFTVMTPNGSIQTGTNNSQVGSFNSDGSTFADWETSDPATLNRTIWLVYSNDNTLTSSTQFGVVSNSTSSDWDTPSSYDSVTTRTTTTAEITDIAFGSTNGTSSTSSVRTATNPTTALYWDSNGAGGLGGTGIWSSSTSDTEWTNLSGGESVDGPFAWGTTSGTTFYAGAGLTAHFGGTAGTVTVSGTVQAHNGLTFASNSYSLTSGTINLAGSSAAANTITVSTSGHTAIISASLTGSNGMTKAGDGTARLDGTNTYTGSTTINAGTLQANAANSLQSTSGITVNTGGSLLVSANNAVNDSAAINLAGGTLALSGNSRSDVMGSLTLTSNSVIDMGTGTGNVWISFNDLTAILSATTQLNIWNYEFGVDHIYFHGNTSNIANATSLANVNFYSGAGTGFLSNGFLSGPELHSAVVPEPEVYATAVLLLLGLGIHFYRQKRRSPHPQL